MISKSLAGIQVKGCMGVADGCAAEADLVRMYIVYSVLEASQKDSRESGHVGKSHGDFFFLTSE